MFAPPPALTQEFTFLVFPGCKGLLPSYEMCFLRGHDHSAEMTTTAAAEIRVLHIFNELRFSGAELMMSSGSGEFVRPGFSQTILATGDAVGEYAPFLARIGYEVAHIPLARKLAYARRLYRFIRGRRFDVVHIQSERANFAHSVIAVLAGARVVRTIHNVFRYSGILGVTRSLERMAQRALGVRQVACSNEVARNERERLGNKVEVVDNWIDPERFQLVTPELRDAARRKLGLAPSEFCFVSLGNCNDAKNHGAIIRALARPPAGINLRYLHLGSGKEQAREEALARELGVFERIRFVQWAENTEDYLVACDAFVSASKVEGGQISLLEAAAVGIPCVTPRVGLAGELDGLPNVFITRAEPEDLAAALGEVGALPISRRLEEAGTLSEAIRTRFIPSVGAARYLQIYETLAGRRGGGR